MIVVYHIDIGIESQHGLSICATQDSLVYSSLTSEGKELVDSILRAMTAAGERAVRDNPDCSDTKLELDDIPDVLNAKEISDD